MGRIGMGWSGMTLGGMEWDWMGYYRTCACVGHGIIDEILKRSQMTADHMVYRTIITRDGHVLLIVTPPWQKKTVQYHRLIGRAVFSVGRVCFLNRHRITRWSNLELYNSYKL